MQSVLSDDKKDYESPIMFEVFSGCVIIYNLLSGCVFWCFFASSYFAASNLNAKDGQSLNSMRKVFKNYFVLTRVRACCSRKDGSCLSSSVFFAERRSLTILHVAIVYSTALNPKRKKVIKRLFSIMKCVLRSSKMTVDIQYQRQRREQVNDEVVCIA